MMNGGVAERARASRTYLRVGGQVFPVYGDVMSGFSPLATDIAGQRPASLYVYESLEELYFALVNLYTVTTGDS